MIDQSHRILHVLLSTRAEGTPRLVLQWLRHCSLEQAVLVLSEQDPDLNEDINALAKIVYYKNVFCPGYRKYPRIIKVVNEAARSFSAKTVIVWPTVAAPWAAMGARMAGAKKLIVHFGNPAARGSKQDRFNRILSWGLWALRADCVCCSKYVERSLSKIPFVSSSIFRSVPNGIDLHDFASVGLGRDPMIVCHKTNPAVMIATLEAHKDHITLLNAIPRVLSQYPDFHLQLVGDGSLRKTIEVHIENLGIGDSVTMVGTQPSVSEFLERASMFIFSTTEREGLGIALIEAMAAGCPIVASDVPACREVLMDGALGLLVPPNDPTAMASAIMRLMSDGAQKLVSADGCQRHLAGYTIEQMIGNYLGAN